MNAFWLRAWLEARWRRTRVAPETSAGDYFAAVADNHFRKLIYSWQNPCTGFVDAETFDRMYHFERAARIYVTALQTGRPLAPLSDEIAEKTARQIEAYPDDEGRHLGELKNILDAEGSDYAD